MGYVRICACEGLGESHCCRPRHSILALRPRSPVRFRCNGSDDRRNGSARPERGGDGGGPRRPLCRRHQGQRRVARSGVAANRVDLAHDGPIRRHRNRATRRSHRPIVGSHRRARHIARLARGGRCAAAAGDQRDQLRALIRDNRRYEPRQRHLHPLQGRVHPDTRLHAAARAGYPVRHPRGRAGVRRLGRLPRPAMESGCDDERHRRVWHRPRFHRRARRHRLGRPVAGAPDEHHDHGQFPGWYDDVIPGADARPAAAAAAA
jgi:hypothetical protein